MSKETAAGTASRESPLIAQHGVGDPGSVG